MTPIVVLALAGVLLVGLNLAPRIVQRVALSSALVALLFGVAVGPAALGWVDPAALGEPHRVLEELALITVALALMSSGLGISRGDLRGDRGPVARLLFVAMPGMWLLTAGAAWLVLDLPLAACLLLGAVLTPTDPVIASALVSGRLAEEYLPRPVRRTLELEAGANDGLALPLVLAPLLAITEPAGEAAGRWALEAVGGVLIAVAIGVVLGVVVARLLTRAVERGEEEPPNVSALGVSLAIATVGAVHLAGGTGILAVFVVAVTLSLLLPEDVRERVAADAETVSLLAFPLLFALLGAMLPWDAWSALGWAGVGFAALVLVARRPPVVPLALAGTGMGWRPTAFLAWFGPLGAAAVYYAARVHGSPVDDGPRIFEAATLAIAASILLHSLTATPAVRAYGGHSPFGTVRHPLERGSEEEP